MLSAASKINEFPLVRKKWTYGLNSDRHDWFLTNLLRLALDSGFESRIGRCDTESYYPIKSSSFSFITNLENCKIPEK